MNQLERLPSPEASSEPALTIERPVVEKRGAGASEFHDKVLNMRREALTVMMNEGMVRKPEGEEKDGKEAERNEYYRDAWEKVGEYLNMVWKKEEPPELVSYFSQPDNYSAFRQLVDKLQADQAWEELLAEQEKSPHARELDALRAFSVVLNEGVRTDGGKKLGAERRAWPTMDPKEERDKRLLRVSELVHAYVDRIELKHDIFKGTKEEALVRLDALRQSEDIPEHYHIEFRIQGSNTQIDAGQ